jgi:hypothetical protein
MTGDGFQCYDMSASFKIDNSRDAGSLQTSSVRLCKGRRVGKAVVFQNRSMFSAVGANTFDMVP